MGCDRKQYRMSTTSTKFTTDSQIARNVLSALSAIHSKSPDLINSEEVVIPANAPLKQRTLEDVRLQVARSIAARAIRKAVGEPPCETPEFICSTVYKRVIDGSKTGVAFTLGKSQDENFLTSVATELRSMLAGHSFLFALTTDTNATPGHSNQRRENIPSTLVILGSSPQFIQRAKILTCSKFLGRTVEIQNGDDNIWIAGVHGMGSSSFDELALKDIVAKSVRNLMEPLIPPPNSVSVDQLVSNARARLERLTPIDAYAELIHDTMPTPVFLVDIRSESQRRIEGDIRGAIAIERNELEWRLDPRAPTRLNIVDRFDVRVVLISRDGKASSLAAVSLHQLGLISATDVIGGYLAWKEAGLPADVHTLNSPTDSYS